ncbi:MAG: aldolase/citrate lyase family protein [Candidatus Paracaedibacteraceae bacterium]|nr:aldolase/citrate lyase family protein [Candidatus Paracaedibacteraceae bacterium]
MILTENKLKIKLKDDQPVVGTWSIISSPIVVEILALSGFDFLILDMEHGIYDQTALDACIRACEAAGCAPIVRVPGINPSAVQWALDMGAHGIVVPQVGNAASARLAIEMTKFAPDGVRGYNPFTRVAGYSAPNSNQIGKLRNDFGLSSVIVENQTALNELDAILAIDDLDMVYIGVYDLSIALGYEGNTKNPELCQLVDQTIVRVKSSGKTAGLMVRSKEDVASATKLGARFMVYSVDTAILSEAAKGAVAAFKQGVADAR